MNAKKQTIKTKGLSDKSLSAKYDTGSLSQRSFDKTLKNMTTRGSIVSQAKKKK